MVACLLSSSSIITACGSAFSAGPGDGGTVSDAPTADAGDGGGDWCALHAAGLAYCEDFDSYSDVTGFLGKETTFSQDGATFSFDHAGVPSPPNALQLVTTSTTNVNALVIEAMPKPPAAPTLQRLEFDLRIDAASSVGALSTAAFAAILFGDSIGNGAVGLAFGNGPTLSAVYLEPPDAGTPGFGTQNSTGAFPTQGQWDGRFAIEIDYGTTSGGGRNACAQLYISNVAQLNPCMSLPASLTHPTSNAIAIGVYSAGLGNTGNVGVRFDNVTFNQQ